jgi:hypothetical protein
VLTNYNTFDVDSIGFVVLYGGQRLAPWRFPPD